MKKLLAIVLAGTMLFAMAACGGGKDADKDENAPKFKTVKEYVDFIGTKADVKQVDEKSAEMIKAEEGLGFLVGDNSFEVYKFSDKGILKEAESGKVKISMGDFGDFESKCKVNGDFVLMYDKEDAAVIDAFTHPNK